MEVPEGVNMEELHLVAPLDDEAGDQFKEDVKRKLGELLENTADSHDLLSEYVLVMLNNLKTMQDIHIQLVELVGEEPAHVLAAWIGEWVYCYENDTYEEEGGVGHEESGYGQEAAEGDGAAETMAQEGDEMQVMEDGGGEAVEGGEDGVVEKAAARMLKNAIEESVKSTSEAPRTVYKTPRTRQGPPPEFQPVVSRRRGRGPVRRRPVGGGGQTGPGPQHVEGPGDVRVIETPYVFTVTGLYDESKLKTLLSTRSVPLRPEAPHPPPSNYHQPPFAPHRFAGGRGGSYGPVFRGRGYYRGGGRSSYHHHSIRAAPYAANNNAFTNQQQQQQAQPASSFSQPANARGGFRAGFGQVFGRPRGGAVGGSRNMQYIAPHVQEQQQQQQQQASNGPASAAGPFRSKHKVWVRPVGPAADARNGQAAEAPSSSSTAMPTS